MPVIKPTCISDIKARVNLADVVSRVVTLRKAGASRLKGLCPFHNEKTPSFHVDTDKGLFHCFGCGKSGDVIAFVRETEQLSFVEAVEALGSRFGIAVEYEEGSSTATREERTLRQELFDLHEQAAAHFHQCFTSDNAAGEFFRTYWTEQRRFAPDLADEFSIGAADESGSGLAGALMRKRFSEDALRKSGLFFIREDAMLTLGAMRPRFRGRLIIPIRDHQGRVVAFTARKTDLTPPDDPAKDAKYVNSPETPIFTKGNLLFNLDRARTAVDEGKPFVLVEGQLDALRCWSVGLKTAVAPQGTSITENQLRLLRRYHPKVECFFDSDPAGQKAALRFLPMALKAGLEVRFLGTGGAEKVDPDLLFLERGLVAYDEVRHSSRSAMSFACAATVADAASVSAEEKSRAAQSIFAIISASESQTLRAEFAAEAAAHLKLPVNAFNGAQQDFQAFLDRLARQSSGTGDPNASSATSPATESSVSRTPEHHLLMLVLHFESLGLPLSHALQYDWVDRAHDAGRLLNRFLGEFEHHSWPGRDHLDPLLETEEERALVAALLFEAPAIDDPVKVAQEGLRQLRSRSLEPRLRQIELALAGAGADINFDAISLLKERTELQRQLRQPFVLAEAV